VSARLPFFRRCVDWPRDDVHGSGGLCDIVAQERDITRRTFLWHVERQDREDVERELGYAPHDPSACLTMARDWHVSYHRSRWHGAAVYFFRHSAIEYVFAAAWEGAQ